MPEKRKVAGTVHLELITEQDRENWNDFIIAMRRERKSATQQLREWIAEVAEVERRRSA